MAMSCDVTVLFCVVLDDCKRDSQSPTWPLPLDFGSKSKKSLGIAGNKPSVLKFRCIQSGLPIQETSLARPLLVASASRTRSAVTIRTGKGKFFVVHSLCLLHVYDDGYQPWYRSIMCIYIYIYIYIYCVCHGA